MDRRKRGREKDGKVVEKEEDKVGRRKMMMAITMTMMIESGGGKKDGDVAEEEEVEEVEPLSCHFSCQIKVINLVGLSQACDGRPREIYISCA